MGSLLMRRACMAAVGNKIPAPKNPIADGVYSQTKNGSSTVTVSNGGQHIHVLHSSSGGNGNISDVIIFPRSDWAANHAVTVEISNYRLISGNPSGGNSPGQGIQLVVTNMTAYNLCFYKDGDGSYTTSTTGISYRDWSLKFNFPYHGAYELEFDFKMYVDGVWYS